MKDELSELLKINNGVLRTQTLIKQGFYTSKIKKLIENQKLVKIGRGIYKVNISPENEWAELNVLVPKGVLCLLSAAFYHELTTFIPSHYQFAIPRHNKIKLPDYPPIEIFYWDEIVYKTGCDIIDIQGVEMRIYDREKTICDIVKYRDKIGLDIFKEVIKNYLQRKDRNIPKLSTYARNMRIYSYLQQYLEILL
jgi:predicted transcriptional regulator of viral defense system